MQSGKVCMSGSVVMGAIFHEAGGAGWRVMDGMEVREENSPDGGARAGVTLCCWMADEALRVVIWNLETVGTPCSPLAGGSRRAGAERCRGGSHQSLDLDQLLARAVSAEGTP